MNQAPKPPELKIVPDADTLYRVAAGEFSRCAQEAIVQHRRFCVALSGGNTPRGVYSFLAATASNVLPWNQIYIFFSDERHVPPDDPESNYRMAYETLLSKVPIPPTNVFRVQAELAADVAAQQYDDQLRSFFGLSSGASTPARAKPARSGDPGASTPARAKPARSGDPGASTPARAKPARSGDPGAWPRFDLIFLGLGDDGHTASLFPGSPALQETSRLVVANWVDKFHSHRITFTYPPLNHAAEVAFLVSGETKSRILHEVLKSAGSGPYPAQLVRPLDGRLLWIADQAAAQLL